MKAIVIKAKSPLRYEVVNLSSDMVHDLQNIVGGYIQTMNPVNLPKPYCMVVNESADLADDPEVNAFASTLFGGFISGDVAFVCEVINENEELDIDGLDVAQVDGLIEYFHDIGLKIEMGCNP